MVADSLQLGETVASVVDSNLGGRQAVNLGGNAVASSKSYSTRAPSIE